MVITPKERSRGVTKFCIRTTTQDYSYFVLNVYPMSTKKLLLPFDYPISGEVKKDEIINYKLSIDGSTNFKMSINLVT